MTKLLVAVDGSGANEPALDWAIAEAARSGASLGIVMIVEPWQVPGYDPPHVSQETHIQPIVDRATDMAAARLGSERVDAIIRDGPRLSVLVKLAENHSGLVVGRRGMGAIRRVLIGSTSIAVAGRSSTPVTIVPETWDGAGADARPVLVGLDAEEEHDAAVRHAFTEAKARGVSLRVLQGWRPPSLFGAMSAAQVNHYGSWQEACHAALRLYIQRMGQEFPGVSVAVDQVIGHPVDVLVEGADDAQLLVLGRDERARWGGFALGSVARNVLPHCEVPVTVVPAELTGDVTR